MHGNHTQSIPGTRTCIMFFFRGSGLRYVRNSNVLVKLDRRLQLTPSIHPSSHHTYYLMHPVYIYRLYTADIHIIIE